MPDEEIFDLNVEVFKRFRIRTSPSDPGRVYRVEMIGWEDEGLKASDFGNSRLIIRFKEVRTLLDQNSLRRRIAAPEQVIDVIQPRPPWEKEIFESDNF